MNLNASSLLGKIGTRRLLAGLAAIALTAATSPFAAATGSGVTFIGMTAINGTAVDKSGLNGAILEDGASPNNAFNGFGSGLAYAGGNTFYGLGDRGPNKVAYSGGAAVDNTTSYPNRFQQMNITLTPVGSPDGNGHYASYTVNVTNTGTTLLKNSQGVQYLGISTAYSTNPAVENHRLDSEAIRVAPDGTTWVSDEYGPYILHFNRYGQEIGSLPLPAGFQISNPGPTATYEAANNTTGRTTNRGMEGLAITPDGKTLVGMMQSSLTQDGGLTGTYVRVLVYDLTNQNVAPKQYAYQLDGTTTPLSELLAVNSHQFLVDERNSSAGTAGIKKLYEFDLNQSPAPTDLTGGPYAGTTASNGLPATGSLSNGVVPLSKTLFADIGTILKNANTATPGSAFTTDSANFLTVLPDKIEGYAWGPDLPDGRHLLLATNDNDFVQPYTTPGGQVTGQGFPTYVWAFAVDPTYVPTYTSQTFLSDAIQSIDHIIVVYQENWPFDGLYGSFPGANGINGQSQSTFTPAAQIDRLGSGPVSNLSTFNNAALTGLTGLATHNPPYPLAADSNGSVIDPHFASLSNSLVPYSLSTYINPTILTGDIYHRYWQEQYQIDGTISDPVHGDSANGNSTGFVTWSDNPGLVLSHFDATNLPEGVLAQQYTICDEFFHSAFGGSFLNHQFLVAAAPPIYYNMPTSNNGNIAYLDSNGVFVMNTAGSSNGKYARDGSITPNVGDVISVAVNGGSASNVTLTSANCEPYAGGPVFDKHYVVNTSRSVNLAGNTDTSASLIAALVPSQNDSNPSDPNRTYDPTIGDLLSQANVSWKWYSGGWTQIVAYSASNPHETTSPSYASVNASLQLQYHHQPLAFFDNYAPFGTGTVPAAYVGGFAGAGTTGLTPGQTITQAVNSAAHIQDETNFFTDVSNNTLPSVVFIKPVGVNNEHPGYAALQTGQAHVASIVQAVENNPTLWSHTAIIVTYDEHGGRWDHVTPPSRDIWGPGQRVPALIISPLAAKGYVDHTQYDTSAILATIENRFNVNSINARDNVTTNPLAANMFASFSTLNVTKGGYVYNRALGQFTQLVKVSNLGSATTVTGPVQLLLEGLTASSNTLLTNRTGYATDGSPYITVTGGNLAPGASIQLTLRFSRPSSGGINYTPRTVTGTTTP